ncbi:hypothetical protein QUF90_20660 [Desulfococcaceae bacterium HSG9]|nr:hypothetical protein [Desulfococcaceae bacterium HSG9]
MSVFNQSNQKVNYQYNANGAINFGNVQNTVDIVKELKKLQDEVVNAADSGALDEEISADVEANIKKAISQSKKSEPDKKIIVGYLNEAKTLLSNIALVAGLVKGISGAIKVVRQIF